MGVQRRADSTRTRLIGMQVDYPVEYILLAGMSKLGSYVLRLTTELRTPAITLRPSLALDSDQLQEDPSCLI